MRDAGVEEGLGAEADDDRDREQPDVPELDLGEVRDPAADQQAEDEAEQDAADQHGVRPRGSLIGQSSGTRRVRRSRSCELGRGRCASPRPRIFRAGGPSTRGRLFEISPAPIRCRRQRSIRANIAASDRPHDPSPSAAQEGPIRVASAPRSSFRIAVSDQSNRGTTCQQGSLEPHVSERRFAPDAAVRRVRFRPARAPAPCPAVSVGVVGSGRRSSSGTDGSRPGR